MSMQQFSEEPASAYAAAPSLTETPPGSEVVSAPAPVSSNAPRYDAETVQKIIALAEKMQTQHRETLTAGDIENLGRDVGVEPEFVRRALAHIEKAQMQPVLVSAGTRRREVSRRSLSLSRLTRRQRATVLVPVALYTVLMPLIMETISPSDNAANLLYVFLPAALAFCLGIKARSKLAGAFGGLLLGLSAVFGLLMNSFYNGRPLPTTGEFFSVLLIFETVGFLLGLGGAVIQQGISGPNKKHDACVSCWKKSAKPKPKAIRTNKKANGFKRLVGGFIRWFRRKLSPVSFRFRAGLPLRFLHRLLIPHRQHG